MGSYIPSTPAERLEMLKAIGLSDFKDLYRDVPASMPRQIPIYRPMVWWIPFLYTHYTYTAEGTSLYRRERQ